MVKKLLLVILLTSFYIYGQGDTSNVVFSDDELIIKEIDESTFLAVHSFPWPANSLVIKFDNGELLFIDTPYTDEATEKLVKFFQGKENKKVHVTAINTHFHVDNLGGNGYLKKIKADIYGSDLTAKLLKERGLGNGMLESFNNTSLKKYYDYYKDIKLTPPEKLFSLDKGLKLSFGKDTIEVYYPGPGHTPDNVVVYYPAKKILFGGCILKSMESNSKGNTGDADIKLWASSLENILLKYPEAKLVIPGHGKEGTVEMIKHSIEVVK